MKYLCSLQLFSAASAESGMATKEMLAFGKLPKTGFCRMRSMHSTNRLSGTAASASRQPLNENIPDDLAIHIADGTSVQVVLYLCPRQNAAAVLWSQHNDIANRTIVYIFNIDVVPCFAAAAVNLATVELGSCRHGSCAACSARRGGWRRTAAASRHGADCEYGGSCGSYVRFHDVDAQWQVRR